jgi:hypothetical protein
VPELLIVKGEAGDSIKIASNGSLFRTVPNLEDLQKALRSYAQYKFLKNMQITDPDIKIEVKLVPYVNGHFDTNMVQSKIVKGLYQYKENERMVLWVKNSGSRPFYFNVLDLQPDGKVNPIMPLKDKRIYADDLKINGGSSRLFKDYVIKVTPPYGNEIFKIFAATDRIDLESITTGESTTRGNFKVLERLVDNSSRYATRGVETENLANVNGTAYNLGFLIVADH